jgi:hypothetical protein
MEQSGIKRKRPGGGVGVGYNPPNASYTQCKVGTLTKKQVQAFMGENGKNFKTWTSDLSVEYIWFNNNKNIIEVWGDEIKIKIAAKQIKNYVNVYNRKIKHDLSI